MKRILKVLLISAVLLCTVLSAQAFVAGDLLKDGIVDLDDAVLLLQHSLFEDAYPIDYEESIDFTGDDSIDLDDAVYLLQYSLFPDAYPIDNPTVADRADKEAYALVYNKGMSGAKEGINSGWVLDNRGGSPRMSNSGISNIGDVSEKYATAFIREFNLVDSGRIVTELSLASSDDGAFVQFRDDNENSTYMLKIVEGYWSVLDADDEYSSLARAKSTNLFRIVTDLDEGVGMVYINGAYCGETELLSDNILSLRVGIDEEGTGSLTLNEINGVVNYAMYENFDLFGIDEVYGWTTDGAYISGGELWLNSGTYAYKEFPAIDGKISAETYFLAPYGSDFSIRLCDILTVESRDGKLVAGSQELYDLTSNMWYRLRINADTDNNSADILLNGRSIGKVSLDKQDGYVCGLSVKSSGRLRLDNMKVYGNETPIDYCPAPEEKANLDDYIVGINVCSLWRNGTHYGWACITPYDEPAPVLGYYDEGVPETADWEINYLVNHGIDVQAFCWFADVSSGPLKKPSWGEQLHDGYMYAKYSDYMKYVIQWETSTASFGSSQFRNYVVPYWFENYFLDDRYLKIDNKIVLSIYNAERLATTYYFGSNEGLVAELDYLKAKAREYGFDGVIVLASGTPTTQFENIGIDGTYAYSWGEDGRKASANKSNITGAAYASDTVHAIPTVSVGFDSIPWLGRRYGLITKQDFKSVLEWVRDEHLPGDTDKPSWAENLVWLSTWNEFGEGTYIFPGGQNGDGFGYVDGVREVFTDLSKSHVDVKPTEEQKARITHLYPQYARLLRREGWYTYNSDISTSEKEPKNKLYINDIDILGNTTEEYHLPPVVEDGRVYFPFNPSTAVNYILGCHYEWRKDEGMLRIMANGHEIEYEVGSDVCRIDGSWDFLGYTVGSIDGVPLLDFASLAEILEYEYEEKDGDLYIYTDTYEEQWVDFLKRTTGVWEFNYNDTEGWSSTHFDMSVGGGSMIMTTNGTTNDPMAYYMLDNFPKDFYTGRYTHLEIKVRFNYSASGKQAIEFFYTTDADSAWNGEKSLRFQTRETNTGENWRTYRLSLENVTKWQSAERITGLRFDPFNCQGTIEIDYIRFIEDPDFEYVPPEEREFAIENGDAEDVSFMPFYSENAKITNVADPDNEDNRVYLVEANPGNQYTYIRHAAEYAPNTTYKIEFDIRLVGNNADDETIDASRGFCCNLRYLDKNASGGIEHTITTVPIAISDGWVHYSDTYRVTNVDSNSGAEFTVYVNPENGAGFNFMIDNISIVKQ